MTASLSLLRHLVAFPSDCRLPQVRDVALCKLGCQCVDS